jgi:hypothetical protein
MLKSKVISLMKEESDKNLELEGTDINDLSVEEDKVAVYNEVTIQETVLKYNIKSGQRKNKMTQNSN